MTPYFESITCICGDPRCVIPFGFCHCGCRQLTPLSSYTNALYKTIKGNPVTWCHGHWNSRKLNGCVCDDPKCRVPYGYCHCGCGQHTKIATATYAEYKVRKGLPLIYYTGHQRRFPPSVLCVCGRENCAIPKGTCHCGCGTNTVPAKQSDRKRGIRVGEPVQFIAGHHRKFNPVIENAEPFKIEGVYCRLIPLTQGLFAIVDAADYEWLMQWKWQAQRNSCNKKFYAQRTELRNGRRICVAMHRFILRLSDDDPHFADHANRVGLDNRRNNLRPATNSENQMNKVMSTTTSGRKGVNWSKQRNKWVARICANRMMIDLGSSDSFEEACALREEGERKYHGTFACSA